MCRSNEIVEMRRPVGRTRIGAGEDRDRRWRLNGSGRRGLTDRELVACVLGPGGGFRRLGSGPQIA